MLSGLIVLLVLEFIFRTILEIREARLFSRKNRFALIRVIPFLMTLFLFQRTFTKKKRIIPLSRFTKKHTRNTVTLFQGFC